MADEQPYFVGTPPQTDDTRALIVWLFEELKRVEAALNDARERLTAGGL